MADDPRNDRASVERQLAELKSARAAQLKARARRRAMTQAAVVGGVVIVGTTLLLGNLLVGGMSPRHPLYWLFGIVGLFVAPFAIWAAWFRATDGELSVEQLDAVIAQVEHDLQAEALIAPGAALRVVEPGSVGGLTEVE